jgi:phosphoglycerate dehydrogenase-like enzyme
MKILVYIVSEPVWTIPPSQVVRLQHLSPRHAFVNAESEQQAMGEIADAEVAFSSLVTPPLFAAAKRLRWIHSPAAGVGRLLFHELRDSDVVVTNSSGLHAASIAEHVFGLAIALSRRFQIAVRRQIEHRFAKDEIGHVRVLGGHRLGIVGLGAIGSAIARLGVAFGMHVAAVREHPEAPAPEGVEKVYGTSELDELLAASDYVVLSAPLTPETTGLIGSRELRLMKPTAFLINIARGRLVREHELADELAKGTIAGAGLDVFEHEPLDPGSPLWDLPNVIITPHTSGFFERYWDAVTDMFADNLRRYERGEPLLNVVDKAAGY